MTSSHSEKAALNPSITLTKAVLRAAEHLAFSHKDLSRTLGVSAASASRLGKTRFIAPQSKEGELALLFIRLFRSLDALFGGQPSACAAWFQASNHHLEGVPAQLVQSVIGLMAVLSYVDAMRGKV